MNNPPPAKPSLLQPDNHNKRYEALFVEIDTGQIKLPMFQREFVGEKVQSAKLIDSILKGVPIPPRLSLRASLIAALSLLVFAPPVRATIPSAQGGPPVWVVDMHTHVFGLGDLPVVGIASAILSGEIKKPDHRAASLKAGATGVAAPPELESALSALQRAVPRNPPPGDPVVKAMLTPPTIPSILLTPAERTALSNYVGEAMQSSEEKSLLPGAPLTNDFELIAGALFKSGFLVESESVDFSAFKKMLRIMLMDYPGIVRALEADFQIRPDYQPDLFVNHMMDLERTFASPPLVSFEAQQRWMEWLDFQWGGKLICFTAFDPFRRDEALASVQAGLDHGAVGIKFYPSSGYRPGDNSIPAPPVETGGGRLERWQSRYANLTNEELNEEMRTLFATATHDQTPIFAHCTNAGFEAVTGYGWNCDPVHWAKVLDQFKTLRLCFGHAGGTQFWFNESMGGLSSDDQRAWKFGEQVVELCLDYPNVYCELGFLEPLLTPEGAMQLKKRLAAKLGEASHSKVPGAPPWKFGDKVMYGTDWHMITQVKDHQRYLQACDEIISAIDRGAWQRKFFAGNAVSYLQLGALAERASFEADRRNYWKRIIAGVK